MKTIFQSESHGGNEMKGSAAILVDGAIEEVFSLGVGLNMRRILDVEKNMSILIEIQDAQTDKVVHTFVITSKETQRIEPPILCRPDDL
ncbi:hypothetical protein [Selenomonas dianae]|uniref:Uncharacterized protein n=1 Tax=Selenomonas dianae TaxID=135079 RepID=A0ABP3CQL1_9FIRM|nr:hypothetical protein [Selenomonas dianae]WLD82589.1 hypothetical protein QU667_00975 [Selenomonas dianae]